MMIRSLGLLDVGRVAVLRAPDIAVKPAGPFAGDHPAFSTSMFLWERLRYKRSSACLVAKEKEKFSGVLSLRPLSGPTSWVVDHLALSYEGENVLGDLLASASACAGKGGAERLFLNLPDKWHVQKLAINSGFVPSMQVLLLTLPGRSPLLKEEPLPNLRKRHPTDDAALFRLYNACTPSDVRAMAGLTLQQWKDSQEPSTRRTRELVLDDGNSSLRGWLRIDHHRRWTRAWLMAHPDRDVDVQSIVAYVLRASGKRTVWWEVPEHQWGLHILLGHIGFEVKSCYMVMAHPLALMIKEPVWATVPTSV